MRTLARANDILTQVEKDDALKKYGYYFALSGNVMNVMTTINARELMLFIRLRSCNRAQWEIHKVSTEISPLSIKDIDNYERLYQEWQSIHPDSYLLFQDTNQKIYYIPDASNMPSQLFRKCLAPHLAAPCWNWKNEAYIDNMMRTMALFKRNG